MVGMKKAARTGAASVYLTLNLSIDVVTLAVQTFEHQRHLTFCH